MHFDPWAEARGSSGARQHWAGLSLGGAEGSGPCRAQPRVTGQPLRFCLDATSPRLVTVETEPPVNQRDSHVSLLRCTHSGASPRWRQCGRDRGPVSVGWSHVGVMGAAPGDVSQVSLTVLLRAGG